MAEADPDDAQPHWAVRVLVALVIFVVGTLLGPVLSDATLAESALLLLVAYIGIALVLTYRDLPLGADLTRSPLLGGLVALAGLGLALAGFVVAVRHGLGLVENATFLTVVAGGYLLGITLVGLGLGSIPTYRQLRTAHGPDPGDAREGRVAIGGTVAPVEGTWSDEPAPTTEPFEAPFSGAESVCLDAQVTEPSEWVRHGTDLLAGERRTVRFDLQGATGRVRVDPTDADLRLDVDLQATVGPDEVTDDVAAYLSDRGVTPHPDDTSRTFVEHRLEPGEAATVVGEARHENGRLVVTAPIIEDGSLTDSLAAYRSAIVRGTVGGLVIALVGFVGLLVAF